MDYITHIEQKIKDIVLKYFSDEPVEVFLFGSRAKGDNKYNSDFDVGLSMLNGEPVNPVKLSKANQELDDEVLVKTDLVDFATKDDIFKQIALQHKVVWKKV
jgi:predicted nucleotidyltransferase